jgi:hypothetical protein
MKPCRLKTVSCHDNDAASLLSEQDISKDLVRGPLCRLVYMVSIFDRDGYLKMLIQRRILRLLQLSVFVTKLYSYFSNSGGQRRHLSSDRAYPWSTAEQNLGNTLSDSGR